MFNWIAERKKKIIIAIVVAAITAATGLPSAAVEAIASAVYSMTEQAPAPTK